MPRFLPKRRTLLMPMRLKVDAQVTVSIPGVGEVTCKAEKLSRSELVVRCGQTALNQMIPEGIVSQSCKVPLTVSFGLPEVESAPAFPGHLRCMSHATGYRRVARNDFLVHLRFQALPLHQAALLEQFIDTNKPGLCVA